MTETSKQDNKIPFLPPSVARSHLKNGRLVEESNIEDIKSALNSIRNGSDCRCSAVELNEYFKSHHIDLKVNFDFIKHNDQYYALYVPDAKKEIIEKEIIEKEIIEKEIIEKEIIEEEIIEEEIIEEEIIEEEIIEEEIIEEEIIEEKNTPLEMENEGGFGSVVLAQNIESLDWAAVKSVREGHENTEIYHEYIEEHDLKTGEVVIMEESHVDITRHNKDIKDEKEGLDMAGQLLGHVRRINEEGKVQDEIIMKLAQGVELADFIMAREMPAIKWIDLAIALMESANKIHDLRLLHRDYKPENFFYDAATGIVTPVDFGMARNYDHTHTFKSHVYEGTPAFSAPELSPYEEQTEYIYTEQTEIYALGATLAEIFGMKDVIVTENEISYDATELENRIDNPIAREKLESLIIRTLSWKANERPTLQEVMRELKVIREQHLDLQSKIVKLAYLDINDYKSLDNTHKGEIIAALRSADEVQLYTGGSQPSEWADIKHELENSGICADDTVVMPGKDIMRVLDSNTTKREKKSDKIYIAFYVTSPDRIDQQSFGNVNVVIADPNARSKSSDESRYYPDRIKASIDPVKLRPEHVSKVKNCINAQIDRLKKHDGNHPQLKAFEAFINTFHNSEPKTYKMLFDNMSKLEKAMKEHAKIAASPHTLFATTYKAVKEARKEIERDVGIRKK